MFRSSLTLALLLSPSALLAPAATAQQAPASGARVVGSDSDVIARIRDEGLNRSQVMPTLSYLTDVIGPRLTASPAMKRANEWTRDKMTRWGLQNAHLEAWGPFGRGWTLERFSAEVVAPQDIPLIAYPKAWSPGLRGTLEGPVVFVDAKTEADLAKYRGKLKGAIVLNSPLRELAAHFEPLGVRRTDAQLQEMETAAPDAPARRPPTPGPNGGKVPTREELRAAQAFAVTKAQFFQQEGVALVVDSSVRGDGGTIFVQSATVPNAPDTPREKRVLPWDKKAPVIAPQMVVASEQYNRMMRMLTQGEPLKMAVQLKVKFQDSDPMGYNTIAEIPGGDLKDQVVMLGAHMDSWHSGTGATDNAAGCAVVMEAVRILKTLNLTPRRTIRVGLWSGEEEGLYGSHAYVAAHFGAVSAPSTGSSVSPSATASSANSAPSAPPVIERKPEYEKLSAYYNLDNGTGKIRGVYLQGNEAMRPIFREWLTPFADLGATTLTIGNTGSTDHVSFDAIGLPGFQFIQDEIEYGSRTHHSNQDVYDRLQADDLKQAAIIMATFAYNTAMRDEMLPRKPLKAADAR